MYKNSPMIRRFVEARLREAQIGHSLLDSYAPHPGDLDNEEWDAYQALERLSEKRCVFWEAVSTFLTRPHRR